MILLEIKKKIEAIKAIYPNLEEAISSQKEIVDSLYKIKIHRNYTNDNIEFERKLAIEYQVLVGLRKELKIRNQPAKKESTLLKLVETFYKITNPVLWVIWVKEEYSKIREKEKNKEKM